MTMIDDGVVLEGPSWFLVVFQKSSTQATMIAELQSLAINGLLLVLSRRCDGDCDQGLAGPGLRREREETVLFECWFACDTTLIWLCRVDNQAAVHRTRTNKEVVRSLWVRPLSLSLSLSFVSCVLFERGRMRTVHYLCVGFEHHLDLGRQTRSLTSVRDAAKKKSIVFSRPSLSCDTTLLFDDWTAAESTEKNRTYVLIAALF